MSAGSLVVVDALSRRMLVLYALVAAGLSTFPYWLGGTYNARLSEHRGHYLVPVHDQVETPAIVRPRHSVVVVLDGVGIEDAKRLRSLERIREHGQCLVTDVGPISVSRPVYAVLSTGTEQDRTGARSNMVGEPLAAESIWQVASESGLSVHAVSELDWWRELFPLGFTTYRKLPASRDYFAEPLQADLTLIHPVYVDDAGHASGAASPHFAESLARVDGELAGLVGRMDFTQDLLVVTADHGHSLTGGHGGRQPRVANVLTCYAGRGVRASADVGHMDATTVAPSVALLMGLRFPRHMRATDDNLDILWRLANPIAFPSGYLQERAQAVEHFRRGNRSQLARWLSGTEDPTWHAMYTAGYQRQGVGVTSVVLVVLALVAALARWRRRHAGWRGALFSTSWVLGVCALSVVLEVMARGSFDLTAINEREGFVRVTAAIGMTSCAVGVALHLAFHRRARLLLTDLGVLMVMWLLLNLGHPAVFGWSVGFPLPAPELIFFPLFASILMWCVCVTALLVAVVLILRPTRDERAAREVARGG
ncbi:MAG: hypothetical protein AB2A00_42975 [Myxococcota bacterium]